MVYILNIKKIIIVNTRLLTCFLTLALSFISVPVLLAQAKVKSVPFTYLPDKSEDRYNQLLTRKTLPLSDSDFAILSRKTDKAYAVERYDANLNKMWSTAIPLTGDETVETFAQNSHGIFVLTRRMDYSLGFQQLFAHQLDPRSGQRSAPKKLYEAPTRGRKIGISVSEDGSKIETFQYLGPEDQVKAITATIYDGNFQKIKDQTYNLRDIGSIFSTTIKIDNKGNQYLCLLSDQNTKLSVRRYPLAGQEAKVMSVQLGGRFAGRDIYVFDLEYQLEQNGVLAVAAICMDKGTADYHSLKMVKFDYGVGEMRFAPEFKFTPEYLTGLSKYYPTEKPVTRLEDIEL
ncbi:MAG TPA: hypothetical protein VK927_05170, partial [Adhaeribacter sp.]|nr:hypothetical protein [Adhaeribacter sp.]